MNNPSNIDLMAERLESLKAGIIGCLCLTLAFIITALVNSLLLIKYVNTLNIYRISTVDFNFLLSIGIAAFSGLLFGVTYRYIIRQDKNPQLKAGGVLAFGLVRGLTQVDVGLSCTSSVLPFVVLGVESIFWFGFAAVAIDTAIFFGWLKAFKSS